MFNYFLLLPNGSASLLRKLNATNFKGLQSIVEKMRNRPVFKASKFREAAALAKRTTGNCFGLIDSVARYRKKLWKSIEGIRASSVFEVETT